MPLKIKAPDVVNTEYIEAHRLGVLIRTPIENVAFFQADQKVVMAHTKTNGEFALEIPLWVIEQTLPGMFTHVHRSYLVQTSLLPGLKHWRKGSHWVFEIITSVRLAGRVGLVDHVIPVSRRLTQQVKAAMNAKAS